MESTETASAPKSAPSASRKRKMSKKLLIGICIAAALIIGGVIALIIILSLRGNTDGDTVYDTDAFFIRETRDAGSKYAIFRNDGTRLTYFEFSNSSVFINGYAVVQASRKQEDGSNKEQYGIVDHTGKMSVDFGEYERIFELSGLFEVKNGDNVKIIAGNGNDVVEGYKDYKRISDAPYVAVETEDKKYTLYNAYGDSILDFESENRPSFKSYDKRVATSMSYDGHLVLLNNKSLKTVFNRETDIRYSISSVSKNEKVFVFAKDDYENRTMAYYANGDFHDLDKQCGTININDDESNKDRYYLTCKKDDGTFLIRDNKVSNIPIGDSTNRYVIYDENHYALYDSKEGKLKIFVNGGEKKTVDCSFTPYITMSGYSLRDSKNNMLALYDKDGEQVYKLEGVASGDLYGIDENGNMIARNSLEKNSDERSYLVTKDGNVVSDKYATITRHGKYYSAYRYDTKKYYLLGGDGKVIVEGDYNGFDYRKKNTVVFGRKGDQYDLIDTEGNSVKVSANGSFSFYDNGYFAITKDDETSYYTHSGNKFYTQKKAEE